MSFERTKVKLGDIVDIFTGYPFKSAQYSENPGDIKLIRGDNIAQGVLRWDGVKRWPVDETDKLDSFWLKGNDVLLAMDRPWIPAGLKFARVYSSDLPCLLVQRVACLRAKNGQDQNFIYSLLSTPAFSEYIQNVTTGTAVPHISVKQIKEFELEKLTLSDEREIGLIHGIIDSRIKSLRETNTTLEAIAQALFKSWFVDFDPVHANAAFLENEQAPSLPAETQALFPSRLVESPQGLIPEGWEVKQLSDVTSYLSRGISPKYVDEGGVCVINQKCIRDFSIDLTKARRHDPSQRKIDGRELVVGDVLINSTGVGTLGRVAQVLELTEIAIVDSHVTVVRVETNLGWIYLGQALMRKQPEIEAMGEGTTGQTELARSKLGLLPIVCPSQAVLKQFDSFILPLKQSTAVNQSKIKVLANLRDTLLPRLISGQLRLPEVEAELSEVLA